MKKRYRDESGQLVESLENIKKETAADAAEYYQIGAIYKYAYDDREYVYLENDDCLAYFQSFDGYNLFTPVDSLVTFLPGVADDDRALALVVD